MLGSGASLQSIGAQAQESLESLQAPDVPTNHRRRRRSSSTSASSFSSRNLDPDPGHGAADLADEYAPLVGPANGPPFGDSRAEDPEGKPGKATKPETRFAYLAFFVLGAAILLPWNATLVSATYFGARLAASPFAKSYMSWMTSLITLANLGFLAHANYTQADANPSRRIFFSISLIGLTILVFALSTLPHSFPPHLFFYSLLFLSVTQSAGGSYLQNAVVTLASWFGPSYLQGILSGQGAIGAAVSVVQLAAAIGGVMAKDPITPSEQLDPLEQYKDKLRHSAFIFFLVSAFFAAFALVCQALLVRMPLCAFVLSSRGKIGSEPDSSSSALGGSTEKPSMRRVERKIRLLGFSILWIFVVTLAVFPAISASILSVNDPLTSPSPSPPGSKGPFWAQPPIFIPIHFVIFNFGDWIGRAMPQVRALVWKGDTRLALASFARTLFVPLFLACNVQGREGRDVLIASDAVYLIILLAFAISNGYVSTLIMIAGISSPSLQKHEVDVAGTCLAFYLTVGLAMGSALSFGVRGLICRCNPFLY